jgi:hypothetical protein
MHLKVSPDARNRRRQGEADVPCGPTCVIRTRLRVFPAADAVQIFRVQNMHQPLALILPSTTLQALVSVQPGGPARAGPAE